MHVENELVEFVTTGEQEYEEVMEEYEEEILVKEGVLTQLTPRLAKASPGA
jgi:hypothetical protein